MTSHSIVDIVVLAILLYYAVKGASRGLLSQLSWVVALLLCFKFSGTLAPAIEPMIGVDPPLKQWLAMLAVYVGLCGVSFVVAGILSSWMAKARIIDFDRHLGGILGFVKGVVICMTVMFFAITMSPPMRSIVSQTYSGYAAATILHNSRHLIPLLPENAVPTVRNVIDNFNKSLQPRTDDLSGATLSDAGTFGFNSSTTTDSTTNSGSGFDLSSLFPDGLRGSSTGSTGTGGASPSGGELSLEDLLSQLPTSLRQSLNEKAMDMLRNSSAKEKQRLWNQLSDSVPQNAESILTNFLSESMDTNRQGGGAVSSTSTQLGQNESSLLNEIAGIYSRRNDIIATSKQYLAGVPSDIQLRVLQDWHADAMGLNIDPDPGTDVNTRLDDRIVRQLSLANISLEHLDRALQTRLSQVMR